MEQVEILGTQHPGTAQILSPDALKFVSRLHLEFNPVRLYLLHRRADRQAELIAGTNPTFLTSTRGVRESGWNVAPAPADLQNRRVEITGPSERKMIINALNSGAQVFMADFEDALAPSWDNVVQGQRNLIDAVRRTIEFKSPEGKLYRLGDRLATLLVRPRGWHLTEKHVRVAGEPISASVFDFGLYFFHNARELLNRGTGPYFYLPKLESYLEARLWHDVFQYAEDALDVPRGTIRATVLIETILAAFEMEEILYELRGYGACLNAGRWDYIFSIIKKFAHRTDFVFPDRAQVTMTVPFMRAYTNLLIQTCHRRGAHAMGGMAAFIPSRRDPEVNAKALAKVRDDKEREATDGFDGTWVAHPDLVSVAMEPFNRVLGEKPHQKERRREDVHVLPDALVDFRVPGGQVTQAGVTNNVSVALQYLDSWLQGTGAAAIYNLMEDAATAEIARSQLWQWTHHGARLAEGRPVTTEFFDQTFTAEVDRLLRNRGDQPSRLQDAATILRGLVSAPHFKEFLTLPAYELLD
jgi:malate synthase